jgi:hypothetical protein
MPYPAMAAAIGSVMRRLPSDTALLIDGTGIGRAMFDLLQDDGLSPISIAITAGIHVHSEGVRYSVPKSALVSKLMALTQSGFLKIHGDLKNWPVLRRELQNFRPERTPAGNETWNAAPGSHDDLIIAMSLCGWWLQSGGANGHGLYQFYREQATGIIAEEFAIGVDVGQATDPSAICVMSKLPAVPDPERDGFFEPTADPEDNRVEWRKRYDAQSTQKTPLHPDRTGGDVEHVNGPRARPYLAPGSIEYAEQQKHD